MSRVLGIVSNTWGSQLLRGDSIVDLAARAAGLGYRQIELRQGRLGEFGTASGAIDVCAFRDAVAELPALRWYVALELPYLSELVPQDRQRFASYVGAAGLERCGWVRIVDLATSWEHGADTAEAARRSSSLAHQAAEQGVRLAVEHARQDWASWLALFRAARQRGATVGHGPVICFDPANLHLFSSSYTA